jgi:hypothetical protein
VIRISAPCTDNVSLLNPEEALLDVHRVDPVDIEQGLLRVEERNVIRTGR